MKLIVSLLVLIAIAFAASLLAGRVWLPPDALLSAHDSLAGLIVQEIRLPRAIGIIWTSGINSPVSRGVIIAKSSK